MKFIFKEHKTEEPYYIMVFLTVYGNCIEIAPTKRACKSIIRRYKRLYDSEELLKIIVYFGKECRELCTI